MSKVNRQTMELVVAVVIAVFALFIILGSLELDTGWSSTGPQSGYFPLRLGILLGLIALGLLVQSLLARKPQIFADAQQLKRSFSVFAPSVVFVLAMQWVGAYVAGALYLIYMARVHGPFPLLKSVAIGVIAMAVFFGVFELWFMVPLPKGPIEQSLGYI